MNVQALAERKATLLAEAESLNNSNGDMNEVKRLFMEAKGLDERIAMAKSIGEMAPVPVEKSNEMVTGREWQEGASIKATKVFSGGTEQANYKAYVFGQYLRAVAGNTKSLKWLKDNGHVKANAEGTDGAGGITVPVITSPDLIYLRESFGVMRQQTRIYPMSNDTLIVPNQTGSTTVYHIGENTAFTPVDFAFTGVTLTAIKMGAYNIVSRELSEDTIIDYASMAARDFTLKLAQQEDLDTFLGDGTATYGGITGVLPAIYGVNTTKANIASLVLTPTGTASPNTFKPTLANLRDMVGRVRWYPGCNPKWYMNRQFWYECVAPLLDTLNGNTIGDIQNAYAQQPTLYGYPVVFTQVLDRFAAATRPLALFGDLSLGTAFGDRRGITIEMSKERYFLEDQVAYKASQRFAFNAYDLGNADALVANRVPGCLIALYSQGT